MPLKSSQAFFSGRNRGQESVVFAYIVETWMQVFSKKKIKIIQYQVTDHLILIASSFKLDY